MYSKYSPHTNVDFKYIRIYKDKDLSHKDCKRRAPFMPRFNDAAWRLDVPFLVKSVSSMKRILARKSRCSAIVMLTTTKAAARMLALSYNPEDLRVCTRW